MDPPPVSILPEHWTKLPLKLQGTEGAARAAFAVGNGLGDASARAQV